MIKVVAFFFMVLTSFFSLRSSTFAVKRDPLIEGAHIEDLPKPLLLTIFNKLEKSCDVSAIARSNRSFRHLSMDILASRRRNISSRKLPLYLEKPAFKQLVTKGFLVDSQKCRWEVENGVTYNFIKSFKADEFYLIKKGVESQDTAQYHFVLNDYSMIYSAVAVEFGFVAVRPGKSYSLKFKRKLN